VTQHLGKAAPIDALSVLDLLVFAPNAWDGRWMNRQHLFSRLGRTHRVLYCTSGWATWDRQSMEWRRAPWKGSITPADSVWVDATPRYLMRAPQWPMLDRLVIRAKARRWNRFFDKQRSHLVAYVFHPMFMPYIGSVEPDSLVYHAYDMYDRMPGWNEELERFEREALSRSDLVIASSDETAEGLRRKVARDIRVLPNGADVEAFRRAAAAPTDAPPDLQRIGKPRLGYTGTINPKVDLPLIWKLARERPDWNFVFVGRTVLADERHRAEWTNCRSLPNVHFLGEKPASEVPRYVAHMDINLMCYRLADDVWTNWIYPLKLHEYLAAGPPIVSSDVPSVRPFRDVIQIASGHESWRAALEQALATGGPGTSGRRQAIAAQNSWDSRAALLSDWLNAMVSSRPAAKG
jgi:glycosyltransferase involved in cell wall biosynthesis